MSERMRYVHILCTLIFKSVLLISFLILNLSIRNQYYNVDAGNFFFFKIKIKLK